VVKSEAVDIISIKNNYWLIKSYLRINFMLFMA